MLSLLWWVEKIRDLILYCSESLMYSNLKFTCLSLLFSPAHGKQEVSLVRLLSFIALVAFKEEQEQIVDRRDGS